MSTCGKYDEQRARVPVAGELVALVAAARSVWVCHRDGEAGKAALPGELDRLRKALDSFDDVMV